VVLDPQGKIHQFDKTGKALKTPGGRGKDEQKFMTCHGLGIDTRLGEPRLLVCVREKLRPCAVSFLGDL